MLLVCRQGSRLTNDKKPGTEKGGGLGAGAQKDITNIGGLWGEKKKPDKVNG